MSEGSHLLLWYPSIKFQYVGPYVRVWGQSEFLRNKSHGHNTVAKYCPDELMQLLGGQDCM